MLFLVLEQQIHRVPWSVLVLLVPLTGPLSFAGAPDAPDLSSRMAALEARHRSLCPQADTTNGLMTALDLWNEDLSTSAGAAAGGRARVDALNRLVFGKVGINASTDLKDPCNLLPSRVLERKRGYCVGIAALYL
jgi:hypothetical protein